MTLITGDERPNMRVGPRAFADVPTAAELDRAKDDVQAMRRSRGILLLVIVLLLGALIATVAFFKLDRDGAQARIEQLTGQLAKTTGDMGQNQQRLAQEKDQLAQDKDQLAAALGPFRSIATTESLISSTRQSLNERLGDAAYEPIKRRLNAADNALLRGEVFWKSANWNANSWKDGVQDNLNQQLDALSALTKKIDKIVADAGLIVSPPRTVCGDPRDPRCNK